MDIFQESHDDNDAGYFNQYRQTQENTLTKQPKVDFTLDGDEAVEDSHF